MRLLGALGLSSGWPLDAKHARGVVRAAADSISRWDRDLVLCNLHSVPPDVPWQAQGLGNAGKSSCTSVLASSLYATQ